MQTYLPTRCRLRNSRWGSQGKRDSNWECSKHRKWLKWAWNAFRSTRGTRTAKQWATTLSTATLRPKVTTLTLSSASSVHNCLRGPQSMGPTTMEKLLLESKPPSMWTCEQRLLRFSTSQTCLWWQSQWRTEQVPKRIWQSVTCRKKTRLGSHKVLGTALLTYLIAQGSLTSASASLATQWCSIGAKWTDCCHLAKSTERRKLRIGSTCTLVSPPKIEVAAPKDESPSTRSKQAKSTISRAIWIWPRCALTHTFR